MPLKLSRRVGEKRGGGYWNCIDLLRYHKWTVSVVVSKTVSDTYYLESLLRICLSCSRHVPCFSRADLACELRQDESCAHQPIFGGGRR